MKINIESIKQISYTGIRRAYAFMGLGINSANNEEFIDYDLSTITKYTFLPTKFSEEGIRILKTEFREWIISNGFREFLGSFEVFLDNVNYTFLNILTSKKLLTPTDAKEEHLIFKRKGITKKIKTLENKMKFKSEYFEHINTLIIARNCFSHRRGIVEKVDINTSNNTFQMTWLGLDLYIKKFDGTRTYIFPSEKCSNDPKHAEKGEQITLEWIKRSKEFPLHYPIKLTPNEISEILSMMENSTIEIINILIKKISEYDIKVEKI